MTRTMKWMQELRDAGLCPTCRNENAEINPRTGKPFWQCKSCRVIHADRMQGIRADLKADATRPSVMCSCGRPMRATANKCFYCRYQASGWKRVEHRKAEKRVFTQPVPKHQPSSIYVQHDPIAARYGWRQAVSR